jgi:predicted TIM-barrel fold metal-dependent hydrolase
MKEEEAFIIDSHIHYGRLTRGYLPGSEIPEMLNIMKKCHIKMAIGTHYASIFTNEFEYGTSETARIIAEHAGILYGYCFYNPMLERESIELVKKSMKANKGFVGIKIYPPTSMIYPNDQRYAALWEYAEAEGVPVLSHTWDPEPKNTSPFDTASVYAQPCLFEPVAERYPKARIILGHTGGHYTGHLQAIKAAQKFPNIYVDMCGDITGSGLLEWFVREIGSTKILFGTDLNLIDPRTALGRVFGANLSREEKENILFKNALSIFRLQQS